jgi:uncharacterized protein
MYGDSLPGSRLRLGNLGKILLLFFLVCIIFIQPSLAQDQQKMSRTLTVSGRGVETIPTTITQVSLAVEVQGKTAQSAQEEAARRSSAVVNLLKNRNVEKLQTTGIHLNPVYSYTDNVEKISGYAANNTVNFRINTENVGTLLDEAVQVGATRINGVSFTASEQAIASAQKQALRQATQDARQQADAVLSSLGFQAQEVVSIQINGASAPPPPMLQRAVMPQATRFEASTPVIGGEQEVEASVTLQITY